MSDIVEMTIKAVTGAALEPAEIDKAYHGLLHFVDSLEKYRGWIKDPQGKTLPGMEAALAEIDQEIADYRALILRLYQDCFTTIRAQPIGIG